MYRHDAGAVDTHAAVRTVALVIADDLSAVFTYNHNARVLIKCSGDALFGGFFFEELAEIFFFTNVKVG